MKKILCAALCAVMLLGLMMPAGAAAVRFDDVPADAWYADVVNTLAQKGVVGGVGAIEGVGSNCFNPTGNVTRAEMTKMLVNSFYRDAFSAYEAEYGELLRLKHGANTYWFSYLSDFAQDNGLLDMPTGGSLMNIDDYADCNTKMTRCEMAVILANAAANKGFAATDAQKAAAQARITDYASIPAAYQDAAKTCFALGLLNGDNGALKGTSNMTRAEACKVIVNMSDLLSGTTTNPDPVVTPTPDVPTGQKDIEVTSKAGSIYIGGTGDGTQAAGTISGNAWTIADNNFGNGYLANGKPVTEDNVLALLADAKAIWTAGMTWTATAAPTGNNWYANPGSVVTSLMAKYNRSDKVGCEGYAAMISDYIFGKSGNPVHQVTNEDDIRPGDIIIQMSKTTNQPTHAVIATSHATTMTRGGTTYHGLIYCTAGNSGNKVVWPTEYTALMGSYQTPNEYWVVYSRYPD